MTTLLIKTPKFRMWLDDDGIIVIEACLPNVEIDLEDARQVTAAGASLSLSRGGKYPLLGDARGLKSITREARQHLASRVVLTETPAMAAVVDSPISRILINFLINVSKPQTTARIFTSREEAHTWLKGYADK